MKWEEILKIDEKSIKDRFYHVDKGKCRSCGTKSNLLETGDVLTGGRRSQFCEKCLDKKIKQYKKKYPKGD